MPLLVSLLLSLSLQAQSDISGAWAITVVDFGQPNTTRLVLKQDGDKLTGTLGNQPLEGTLPEPISRSKSATEKRGGSLRTAALLAR